MMDAIFTALDNAADGAFVIDEHQRVVFWNGAAERLLGYVAADVIGRLCHEVIRGRDEQEHAWCRENCAVVRSVQAGEPVETFLTLAHTKGGGLRWVQVSILVIRTLGEDRPGRIVHLMRDATAARQRDQLAQELANLVERFSTVASSPVAARVGDARAAILTNREQDVLALLAKGMSTEEIATALSLSRTTIRDHVQNILQKLGVHSRAEAVAFAFQHGLVRPE